MCISGARYAEGRLGKNAQLEQVHEMRFPSAIIRWGRDTHTIQLGWSDSAAADMENESSSVASPHVIIEQAGGCSIRMNVATRRPILIMSRTTDEAWVLAEEGSESFWPLPRLYDDAKAGFNVRLLNDDVERSSGEITISPPAVDVDHRKTDEE